MSSGSVSHAYLGASVGDGSATVGGDGHEAAVIQGVTAGAPADKAGLKAGDAVIAVNGQPVDGADSLVAQIRAMDPGTQVKLTVVRGGSSTDVTVSLAARPAGN
jgi:putative serine protease PepD